VRQTPSFHTARTLRAACILAALCLLSAASFAALTGNATSATSTPVVVKSPLKSTTAPLWSALTPAQQDALAPLSGEWDKLDSLRKDKWLQIAAKFAKLSPAEQQRTHERMRDWAKMTPDERRVVRENYARAKKITPSQKTEKWQQYQQLPEEQKNKLAAEAQNKKRLTNLPSASAATKTKIVPPIKLVAKPNKQPLLAGPVPSIATAKSSTPSSLVGSPAAVASSTTASPAALTTPPTVPQPITK
jgi:predicted Fe-S protein YdhL (DUF1289 family)